MARTFVAVLTGLLVCSASHAQELHEKWLKYLAGKWQTQATTFQTWTGTFTLAPGNHALLGTGNAEDTGETTELLGWEPDKKALVHTWYGRKKSCYSRFVYTKVSDTELSGEDSGFTPGGRPYSGRITVRRVDDDTISFEYSGNYTDGKKEKYEGKGTSKRVKSEGKVPAAEAFKDFGSFLDGGVWMTTDSQGRKWEDRWEWILNKSFLQCTSKVGDEIRILINGLDPATGRWLSWGFDNKGRTYKTVLTSDKPGEWALYSTGQGKDGANSFKFKGTKKGPDEVCVEFLEVIVDGKKQPPEVQTWMRKQ